MSEGSTMERKLNYYNIDNDVNSLSKQSRVLVTKHSITHLVWHTFQSMALRKRIKIKITKLCKPKKKKDTTQNIVINMAQIVCNYVSYALFLYNIYVLYFVLLVCFLYILFAVTALCTCFTIS